MHLDLTSLLVNRYVGHLSNIGSETGVLGNAASLALRNRFTPTGLFCNDFQDPVRPLIVLQVLQAKLQGIFPGSMG